MALIGIILQKFLFVLSILIMKKKYKTNKSTLKRIKLKKNCIQRKQSNKSHLLLNKQTKTLRALKINSQISKADLSLIKSLI